MVFAKRFQRILTVNEMYLGFLPERGIIDAVSMFRRLQKSIMLKKLYMCFVDLETTFYIVPRKVLEGQ